MLKRRIFLAVTSVFFLCACTQDQGSQLLGRWQWVNTVEPRGSGTFVIEFFKEGAVSTTFKNSINPVFNGTKTGEYQMLEGGRLKINIFLAEWMPSGQPVAPQTIYLMPIETIVKVQVTGDELTIITDQNQKLIYRRLK